MQRIFIVGCPRSGTTLLQSMLLAQGDLFSLPETHTLRLGIGRGGSQFFGPFRRNGLLAKLAGECDMLWCPNIWRRFLIMACPRYYVQEAIKILDNAASSRNCVGWVEKTPEHLFYVDRIQKGNPKIKFVHMVRNGKDTAASVVDMWGKYTEKWPKWRLWLMMFNDLVKGLQMWEELGQPNKSAIFGKIIKYRRFIRSAKLWNDSIKMTQKHQFGSNHFICSFEQLLHDTERVLCSICSFLSIRYRREMLEPQNVAKDLIRENEPWKKNNFSTLTSPVCSKYDQLPVDIKLILKAILTNEGNIESLSESCPHPLDCER